MPLPPISIHAPHARSDSIDASHKSSGGWKHFNPRSSCEERPDLRDNRATLPYFNPRSSCEERRPHWRGDESACGISIHAPHARSDSTATGHCTGMHNFNPRSSCEERRCVKPNGHINIADFNPRSSCEERRAACIDTMSRRANFNPRSSCEERPALLIAMSFLS